MQKLAASLLLKEAASETSASARAAALQGSEIDRCRLETQRVSVQVASHTQTFLVTIDMPSGRLPLDLHMQSSGLQMRRDV